MSYPITDEIKKGTSPHTFRVDTGIDLTSATEVKLWWRSPIGADTLVTGSKTQTPSDGIIEWTDTPVFWTSEGYWYGEAYVYFGTEFLVGDVWVTPVVNVLGLS